MPEEKKYLKSIMLVLLLFLYAPIPFMLLDNWFIIPLITDGGKSTGTITEIVNGEDTDSGHEYIYNGIFIVQKDTFKFNFNEFSGITDKSSYYYLHNHDYFKGDKIEIIYNKNNPTINIINNINLKYGVFIYIIVVVLLNIIYIVFRKRRQKHHTNL